MGKRGNDDDIKIAPDDITKLFEEEQPKSDDTIDLFLKQRSLGNIEKAHKLGRAYVADMLDCVNTLAPDGVVPFEYELQLRLLFSYVVNRVIEDCSPNVILAHTALSTFYECLEDAQPDMFDCINDCAAFSLYLYLHRSGEETPRSVGKTFAKLCGVPESEACIAVGESAYTAFVQECYQRMKVAGYRH